jgi:hypothetical protein
MKAILEFNLPEDREDYALHFNAGAFYSAMWDYAEWLRGICKHGNPNDFNAEACRGKLFDFLNERDLSL